MTASDIKLKEIKAFSVITITIVVVIVANGAAKCSFKSLFLLSSHQVIGVLM